MVAVQLTQKLRERGHRLTFLTELDSPSQMALMETDISVLSMSIRGYFDPSTVSKIRKCIRQEDVDLVHAHYSKDLWALVPALSQRAKRIPLVLTKHIGTMSPKKDLLHRWIYQRVDTIIAISRIIKQNVIQTHPVRREKVEFIPNGVDLATFDPEAVDRIQVRASLGIPSDATVVGITGRLNWWKGYREFLEMAECVLKIKSQTWFLVVGGATICEEKEAEEIQNFARSLRLDGKVIFTGFRNDVPHLLSAMDIFVYPAYAEAFGLVLIEAMAMCLPVISSNCDGVPEIVVDGKTGSLIPSRDSMSLTDAVLEMLEHTGRMKRYGQAGRSRVLQFFDLEKGVSRIEDLYERLIQKRSVL